MKGLSQKVEKLLNWLNRFKPKPFNVAVMPDFFLDRFVLWNGDFREFYRNLHEVAKRKGGSIDNVVQIEFRGGNAVNTAAALAVLGVNVFPIVYTDKFGLNILKFYLKPLNIDLSYVKINDKMSVTTALEFSHGKEKRNVMLRDLGALRKFRPSNLTKKDFALLQKTDYICVFNWAGTRRHGTELAQTVFRYVKAMGRGKTYYDTADPLSNKPKIPELVEKVLLCQNLIDVLSLNENEAITYAKYVAPEQTDKLRKQHKSIPAFAKECAKLLAQRLTSRIDLHATTYSATFSKKEETIVPAFKVEALRATGAGDAWNAGNIYADANNFPADERLTFANAVAAYYLSSPNCEHPRLLQIRKFLQKALNKSHE
ncbi:MAG: carbohydrate kinase family protein [Candidatus Bathyarchaeia archaeon]